jgi:hypothetical protein
MTDPAPMSKRPALVWITQSLLVVVIGFLSYGVLAMLVTLSSRMLKKSALAGSD